MSPKTLSIIALSAIVLHQPMLLASEADDNRIIARECKSKSMEYNDGDTQSTTICMSAIYYKCTAKAFESKYPDKIEKMRAVVSESCNSLARLNKYSSQTIRCPACE